MLKSLTLTFFVFSLPALADRHPAPVHDPVSVISTQTRVEIGPVGIDAHRGATSRELDRILARPDALSTLLTMARASSPVSRVAAAAGLMGRTDVASITALDALLEDQAFVDVMLGCMIERMTVSDAVLDIAQSEKAPMILTVPSQ